MAFKEMQCSSFIEQLASGAPVPGGGGAAALVAAVGTALGNMVGSLTLGKKKYAEVQDEIMLLKKQCDELQDNFLALIDADAEAFSPLANAYGLPKESDEQAEYKARVMEDALDIAASVPVKIVDTCCDALDLMQRMGQIGTAMAISDVACGAVMLKASLEAAAVNVYINTRLMRDREDADELNRSTAEKVAAYTAKADEIYEEIAAKLKKSVH